MANSCPPQKLGMSGESEQHAVSRMNSGLWHGTTQDDDLLAKDGVFDKEGGAGSEGRTQRAHDGFEDFDEHRGAQPKFDCTRSRLKELVLSVDGSW
jgi:hypothetical protein